MATYACAKSPDISKSTVKAMFPENTHTREFLDSLDDDQWVITSFDNNTREVCFDLTSNSGILLHLSLILPKLN